MRNLEVAHFRVSQRRATRRLHVLIAFYSP